MSKKVTFLDGESFEYDCVVCKDRELPDGEGCEECCDHDYDSSEGYHCLNSGKDGSEDVMAAAFDHAKDLAKYGE